MIKRVEGFAYRVSFYLKCWQEKWQAFMDAERQKYYADPKSYDRNMRTWFMKFGTGILLYIVLFEILVGGK